MESPTAATFIKNILEAKVLDCAICKNVLATPVFMVEAVGNVCQQCFQPTHELKIHLPNRSLDVILQELSFPCKFQLEGCPSHIPYADLKNHENNCRFRHMSCILTGCEWRGAVTDLFQHFTAKHSEYVNKNFKVVFRVNLHGQVEVLKLMVIKSEVYTLKIHQNEHNELVHHLQCVDDESALKEWVVQYKSSKTEIAFNIICCPFSQSNDVALKIRKKMIDEIFGSGENLVITVKPSKYTKTNLISEILEILECLVCRELMRSPINMCNTGHSLCLKCYENLSNCPICRASLSSARNYSLEAITPSIKYQCVYSKNGCIGTYLGTEIGRHEEICEYKIVSCPIFGCKFTGNYLFSKRHLELHHADVFTPGTIYTNSFVPEENYIDHVTYFCEYDNIFQLRFVQNRDRCYCFIIILTTYDKNANYYYTITVFNSGKPLTKLSKTMSCIGVDSLMGDDNNISFFYADLELYKNTLNGHVTYTCQLFRS